MTPNFNSVEQTLNGISFNPDEGRYYGVDPNGKPCLIVAPKRDNTASRLFALTSFEGVPEGGKLILRDKDGVEHIAGPTGWFVIEDRELPLSDQDMRERYFDVAVDHFLWVMGHESNLECYAPKTA